MSKDEPRTECRTPNPDKPGTTRIPTWKFELMKTHILAVVEEAGAEGVVFKDLSGLVGERLGDEEKAKLGSLGWHCTTVKLELEVAGDISRLDGVSPQRIVLGS